MGRFINQSKPGNWQRSSSERTAALRFFMAFVRSVMCTSLEQLRRIQPEHLVLHASQLSNLGSLPAPRPIWQWI